MKINYFKELRERPRHYIFRHFNINANRISERKIEVGLRKSNMEVCMNKRENKCPEVDMQNFYINKQWAWV